MLRKSPLRPFHLLSANEMGTWYSYLSTPFSSCPIDHREKTPEHREEYGSPPTRSVKPFESIPGPPIYPVIGSVWDIKKRAGKGKMFYEIVKDYRYEYGPIVRTKLFDKYNVYVYDPREFLKGIVMS